MPEKVFVYSSDSANQHTISIFRNRGYEPKALGDDDDIFWSILIQLEARSTLVLLSHGDENGPLLVRGNQGGDMSDEDITTLGEHLRLGGITFYLLSCHTGKDPFFTKLKATGATFAAPIGYASVESGAGMCNVYSKEDKTFVGWVGTGALAGVSEQRKTKPLAIR